MSATPETRLFGSVERRLFRVTAILFTIAALGLLIGGMVWVLAKFLSYFYNLILPLAVAGILGLVLYPVVEYLEERVGLPRVAAASVIVLLFILVIGGAVLLLLPTLFRQIGQFIEIAPGVIAGWQEYLSRHFPSLTRAVVESAQDGSLKEMVPDMETTGSTIRSYTGIVVGLSLVPLLLFFTLLSGDRLRRQVNETLSVLNARTQQKIMYFIDVFMRQVTAFFQGQLVIAVIMGAMLATGFTLIGLKGGILIGLVLGLLNIVPYLGTLLGLLIVLPIAYFQPDGSFQLVGLSLLVFTVVQIVESWLLTPKIMANRSGLHPALVVISVFFWGIALGGAIGMILAVPLTAFIVAVWSQAKEGLSRSLTSDDDPGRIETPRGARESEPDSLEGSSNATRQAPDKRLIIT
ncbi:putative PurR-regulated permease PerM [Natronocella acetinitrilica]|uniref:PurR-regulated permease PerM n=1 Tax=Natronocella acetinitrilica TaxID=414046 RepID=A0AAE3G8W6_9GAMM|nr:AI-2E family transporter [Natronocella acetinitrilica]MCP1676946.1 putative PurR-regulated permease PerM [Natronocella acetinitrilica]